jgi:hypothetical protein
MDVIFIILWFLCSIAVWIIYHKLFNVMYFDLFNGCLTEFITSGFLGAIIAAMIIRFWWVTIVIFILLGIAISKKH